MQDSREQLRKALEAQKQIQTLGFRIVETEPWVPCKIGGKEYKLEYSFGAVKEIYRKTGLALGAFLNPANLLDLEIFPVVLIAGLRTHHRDEFPFVGTDDDTKQLQIAGLMDRIPMKHLQYYVVCITAAIQATEPDQDEIARIMGTLKEVGEANDPLASNGTLPYSGPDVVISGSQS